MARLFSTSTTFRKPGYLYVLLNKDGFRKIGISIDPKERVESIRRECSDPSIEIELLYEVENMRDNEKRLHEQFSECRVFGEWFNLSDKDLDDLDGIVMGGI